MTPVRISLAALAVLVTVAGCSAQVSGSAAPSGDGFIVKDGTLLHFRPVLTELPPSPTPAPTGSAPDRQSADPAAQQAAAAALDCAPGSPDPLVEPGRPGAAAGQLRPREGHEVRARPGVPERRRRRLGGRPPRPAVGSPGHRPPVHRGRHPDLGGVDRRERRQAGRDGAAEPRAHRGRPSSPPSPAAKRRSPGSSPCPRRGSWPATSRAISRGGSRLPCRLPCSSCS